MSSNTSSASGMMSGAPKSVARKVASKKDVVVEVAAPAPVVAAKAEKAAKAPKAAKAAPVVVAATPVEAAAPCRRRRAHDDA